MSTSASARPLTSEQVFESAAQMRYRFLRRIATGSIGTEAVFKELQEFIPPAAQVNRFHPWWATTGNAFFDVVVGVATSRLHLFVKSAARQAIRTRGRIVVDYLAGVHVYRVFPAQEARIATVKQVIAEVESLRRPVDACWSRRMPSMECFRDLTERQYLMRLVARHGWHVTRAAREAGISRQTLTRLLGQHGLRRPKNDEPIRERTLHPVHQEA